MAVIEKIIPLHEYSHTQMLFGERDELIRPLESEFDVEIYPNTDKVRIRGTARKIDRVIKVLELLLSDLQEGKVTSTDDLNYLIAQVKQNLDFTVDDLKTSSVTVSKTGKLIKAKRPNQNRYIRLIQQRDMVFGIGPAGTGKTYLAVALGMHGLIEGQYKKLILTRPVVEAGESLGFLPGDLQQKVNPYLRPLFDAILDMISFEEFTSYKEKEVIEIAPLAYMRGRTLNNAYVILDEAQNTTIPQIKMFLSRMGQDSKMVITGDLTQIDLPPKIASGLIFANKFLKSIEEIGFVYFQPQDIIRHPLVGRILDAFERANA